MKTKLSNVLKTSSRTAMVLLCCATILSCSKDDETQDNTDPQARENFTDSYFGVLDADFSDNALPVSNSESLAIVDLNGNSTVLAGGSNPIEISTEGNVSKIIIGVKNENGYFSLPANTAGRQMNSSANGVQLLIGREVQSDFTIAFAVGDGQGNISPYEYLPVSLMSAGTGLLQVSLSWNQLNDVDLHLIEPDGEEIYYGNSFSSNGGELDVDSNAACSIDEINNENIFYEDSGDVTIESGEYEVLVDLWSNCNIEENTNYTVTVYYGDALIATTEGTNPYSGTFTPEDESHNSNPTSVLKFNIPADPGGRGTLVNPNGLNYSSQPAMIRFDFDDDGAKRNKILSPEKM